MKKEVLSIDIETFSTYDIKLGVYKYAEGAELLLTAFAFGSSPVYLIDNYNYGFPEHVKAALTNPNVIKNAFNANFEITVLRECLNIDLDPAQWRCTMVGAAMTGLPLRLEEVAKVLNLENQKDKSGKSLIDFFSKPCKPTKANGMRTRNLPEHDPEKWKQFGLYCMQDVETEREIKQTVNFFGFHDEDSSYKKEHELWVLDQKINARGVYVDKPFIENAIKLDLNFREKLTKRACEITGLTNPNSVAQLKEWLSEEMDEEVTTLRKDDYPKMLENTDSEAAKEIISIRQDLSKTSVKKFSAMLNSMRSDGRVRGLLQFYGANRTGRWSGRLVQVQNLPRGHFKNVDLPRSVVRSGNASMLELLYGAIPLTLSALIRSSFIPENGKKLLISDFSAIEARVIAWLADETWRLDVFKSHGKIYEASAAMMLGINIEDVSSDQRQKGKVAELALGYQGGVNALIRMGALDMGIHEDELQGIVDSWRSASKKIKNLWYTVNKAAINAIKTGEKTPVYKGVTFHYTKQWLFLTLPSGRRLSYAYASIEDGQYGDKVIYYGMDPVKKKWVKTDSYGGKFVENCLSGNTLVLTNLGFKKITEVNCSDLLWDGLQWVNHSGLIEKGTQNTINVNGVNLTADHKILTNEGWKEASSCKGLNWNEVQFPDGNKLRRIKRVKINLECKMCMRGGKANSRKRIEKIKNKILRVYSVQNNFRKERDTQTISTSDLLGMAEHESTLHQPKKSSVEKLRRKGDKSMSGMVGQLRSFPGRYVKHLCKRAYFRQDGRKRGLQKRKLSLGNCQKTRQQPTYKYFDNLKIRSNYGGGAFRYNRYRSHYSSLPISTRGNGGRFTEKAGCYESVYDLMNAGHRNRFTVLSDNGLMIVHNCVQAISRDLLANGLMKVAEAGHDIIFHVHDEVVIESPLITDIEEINALLCDLPIWAEGLPLAADGFESFYYKK